MMQLRWVHEPATEIAALWCVEDQKGPFEVEEKMRKHAHELERTHAHMHYEQGPLKL